MAENAEVIEQTEGGCREELFGWLRFGCAAGNRRGRRHRLSPQKHPRPMLHKSRLQRNRNTSSSPRSSSLASTPRPTRPRNLKQQLSKAFGTMGNMQQLINQVRSQTPAGAVVEITDEDFAELKEDFPELAGHTRAALERILKRANVKEHRRAGDLRGRSPDGAHHSSRDRPPTRPRRPERSAPRMADHRGLCRLPGVAG